MVTGPARGLSTAFLKARVPACDARLSSGQSSGYLGKSIEINASSPRIAIRGCNIVAREGRIAAAVDPMEGAMAVAIPGTPMVG